LRSVSISGGGGTSKLQFLPISDGHWGSLLYRRGLPEYYTLFGGSSLQLGPMPDGAYSIGVLYQGGVPPLSDASPSNWLLTSSPDAYLFGTLVEAEAFIGHDERITIWLQRRDAAFAGIEMADRKARWPGGPLQITVDGITGPGGSGGMASGGGGVSVDPLPLPGAGSTGTNVHIGDTAPTAPTAGDLWWDSSSAAGGGQLYIYYLDPTGPGQWVAATNQQAGAAGMVSLTPTSGDTVTLTPETPNVYISSGALAALTIRLPATAPLDRQVQIGFANPVETLTVQDSLGAAVAGAPTSAYGPGAALLFRWVPPWVHWK
jgi:hypothetical protein